jgi:raw score 2.75
MMAYHISLVNTDKKDISSKLIINKEKFREFLFREFNMKEELNENGVLEFYYDKDDPSFTIFYTEGIEGEYYINTTDDKHIEKLIAIAEKLNDGTRVRGDEGETYKSLEDVYIHPDDVLLNNITFMDRIKIRVKANICLIIWGIISLVIVLYKIINDHIQ